MLRRNAVLKAACAVALAVTSLVCGAARAETAPQAPGPTYGIKECEQDDRAWLALRACTSLLKSEGLGDSERSRVLARRGLAWIIEDDAAEAVADFTRAIELDSGNVRAFTGRARANTLLGEHKAAAEDWSVVIAHEPDAEALYLKRGASWLAAENAEAAMGDFDKAIALNPKSIEGHIGRANVYVLKKSRAEAERAFDAAQGIDPKNFAPYLARAEAAEIWGDTKLAIANYSTALSLKTTVWAARKALKRLGIDTPP